MNNLLFDFTVDKATKTVFITREFDADLSLVWDAFTKPEILDQWVAPKPWVSKTKVKMFNAFADKDENPELPGSDWDYSFSEQDGKTKVSITIYNESLARMEKMIEMGFTEGFKMSMENLEQYIEAQFKLRKQNKISNKARVSSYLNFDGKTEKA